MEFALDTFSGLMTKEVVTVLAVLGTLFVAYKAGRKGLSLAASVISNIKPIALGVAGLCIAGTTIGSYGVGELFEYVGTPSPMDNVAELETPYSSVTALLDELDDNGQPIDVKNVEAILQFVEKRDEIRRLNSPIPVFLQEGEEPVGAFKSENFIKKDDNFQIKFEPKSVPACDIPEQEIYLDGAMTYQKMRADKWNIFVPIGEGAEETPTIYFEGNGRVREQLLTDEQREDLLGQSRLHVGSPGHFDEKGEPVSIPMPRIFGSIWNAGPDFSPLSTIFAVIGGAIVTVISALCLAPHEVHKQYD